MSISKWCAVTRKAVANVKPNSIAVLQAIVLAATAATAQSLPNLFPILNGSGFLETYHINSWRI
jgi:hypothetical protein